MNLWAKLQKHAKYTFKFKIITCSYYGCVWDKNCTISPFKAYFGNCT